MQKLTPIKAIRKKCLDCCCGSSNEVKLCQVESCALHPYRFGKNPNYIPKEPTAAQQKARNAAVARLSNRNHCNKSTNTPTEGKDTTGDINLPEQAV